MVINIKLWIFALKLGLLEMDNIGFFCSASNNIDAIYLDNVAALATWLGKSRKTIIYGGVNSGLMEVIAKNVNRNGGKVVGVVPDSKQDKISPHLHDTIITNTLGERKDQIVALADVLVVLPGGLGTLDEVLHALSAKTLGYNTKHIIFYNINGFFSNLLTYFAELKRDGFINSPLSALYTVANTENELKLLLK